MRKPTLYALALMASIPVLGATVSCNSAWWKNFESNPVAEVQSFEQGVQVVLNDAQLAWTIVQPYLPPATAAAINLQFNNAVFAVNHALVALNDAVQAAVAAQNPNPDFSAMMASVTDAIAQVIAIIDQYTNLQIVTDGGATVTATNNGKAPMSPMLVDAHAGLTSLKLHWVPAKVVPVVVAPPRH
jgi:leucyl aminopeptidase (aminopeptidase T)